MFTTPCIIKNSHELQEKLSEFGYNKGSNEWDLKKYYKKLFVYQYPMKDFNTPYFVVGDSLDLTEVGLLKNKFIDCGNNLELFLAVAAFRDDSDCMQWFCDYDGRFWFCETEVEESRKYGWTHGEHKATVEELIKYFKNKLDYEKEKEIVF